MKKPWIISLLFLPFISSCITTSSSLGQAEVDEAKTFVAFSLNAAKGKIMSAQEKGEDFRKIFPDAWRLGYMSRPIGLVLDTKDKDLILIGEKADNPNLFLDDFVSALKSLYIYGVYPQLTIDPEGGGQEAKWHQVRMTKGIENSHFGRVFFESDYLLKKISLNLIKVKAPGFKSQYQLLAEKRRKDNVYSRFWFKPSSVEILVSSNVIFINRYPVHVLSESLYADDPTDMTALRFSQSLTDRYDEISKVFPVFEDLRNLLRWVGIVGSVSSLGTFPDLKFWLQDYAIEKIKIPQRVRALSNIYGDLDFVLRVYGGVDSVFLSLRLKAKDAGALGGLAKLVTDSRPSCDSLSWEFPLKGYKLNCPLRSKSDIAELESLLAEAYIFASKKEYEKAISDFNKAIEIVPDFSRVWYLKGELLHGLGEYKEALACYDKALRINPQEADALVNKSDVLLKLKRFQEALRYAESALKINSKDFTAWYNKGEALENLDRTAEAIKAYEMFIKFAPPDDSDMQKARDRICRLKKVD